jgi:hypothetical protein
VTLFEREYEELVGAPRRSDLKLQRGVPESLRNIRLRHPVASTSDSFQSVRVEVVHKLSNCIAARLRRRCVSAFCDLKNKTAKFWFFCKNTASVGWTKEENTRH